MEKKVRGPRRLEYVPDFAKGISGIEFVTTVAQLARLKEYITADPNERKPFIRLGCSVSHDKLASTGAPQNSTWAVSCAGNVEVIRKDGDPRTAYKWFSNSARQWNIYHEFRPDPQILDQNRKNRGTEPAYFIAVLSVEDEADGVALLPFEPDGSDILSTRYRRLRNNPGLVEALVFARQGWFEAERFSKVLFSVREAMGEFFANEDGAVWVAADTCIEFASLSYADTEAMAHNREKVPALDSFLHNQAVLYVRSKLRPFGMGRALDKAVETAIAEVLHEQNLKEISLLELEDLVPIIQKRAAGKAA